MVILLSALTQKHQQWHEVRVLKKHQKLRALANSNNGHQFIDFVRRAVLARLTEVVGGVELEVDGSGEEEYEVDVACEDDVCDEDVNTGAVDEVGGAEEEESEGGSEEDTTGVVEEEKKTDDDDDEDVVSRCEKLLDVVEVLTLSLEEVEAAVLLA